MLAVTVTAALASPLAAPLAHADPNDPDTPSAGDVRSAQDDAAHAKTKVGRVGERLDAATAALDAASARAAQAAEAWNGARWQAAKARQAERRATAASAKAERTLAVHKRTYRDTVITVGTSGYEVSAAGSLLAADDMAGMLETEASNDHVQALLGQRYEDYMDALSAAEKARTRAEAATKNAESKVASARTARESARSAAAVAASTAGKIERRKTRLIATLARLQGVSVAVAKQRRDGLAAQRAAARAAAARASAPVAPAPSSPAPSSPAPSKPAPSNPAPSNPAPSNPAPSNPAPPSGQGGQAAVAFARAQIGEPYVWGAAGPSTWDCSGLTAKAWSSAGKYLPHYSVAQYDASTPINPSQLKPGDLVFWGSNGNPSSIYHVALYAGNQMIIHAPRTGRNVTEESMYYWRTPDFYARP
ncbi:MAG: C40 family peptidase [Nocardioidaceae bacterium]|nr:C40 family peptidase [Nocardioidaceae bacterium]